MVDEKSGVNTKYKDRLFNFIFGSEENRDWTLSLYNAVNGSNYKDASVIKFNTLDDVLFMGMKNDTSFLISWVLNVYEHQSTYNRNMPLRMLQYLSDLYSGYIEQNRLNKYSSKLIKLPVPKLVVFYNGEQDTDDEVILHLSDAFDKDLRSEADVEVRVRMLNINHGHNKKIMEACRPLYEYSWFIEEVRKCRKECDLNTAVETALKAMDDSFIIKEFMVKNRSEVKGMLDTEYNEAEVMELFKEEAREEGREEGRKEGRKEGREEERANTLREKKRADTAEKRAERAEKMLREMGVRI